VPQGIVQNASQAFVISCSLSSDELQKTTKLRTMSTSSKARVAILDDRQNIATPKFSHLESRIQITSFPETINLQNAEQTKALIARLQPFTIISTMGERTSLPGEVISSLPNLKVILTTGMKNAAIDMKACSEHGIIVAGAKGVGRSDSTSSQQRTATSLDSTMQHTWALILGLARNIARDDAGIKHGGWENSFATGLTGKTLGLLGLGKLGADTAKVGVLAFGMKVAAWSSSLTQEAADEKAKTFGLPAGTFKVVGSKDELFQAADVLSVHYVLSERSRDIVSERELALLKPTALFVNTSRGPLVNEKALLSVLKAGKIRGAALDVYNIEPLPIDSEWRTTDWGKNGSSEVLLSPHMGYVEEGVMHRWYEETVENVERWLDGCDLLNKLS
jgi:lactate dehydrogenase-like 2-hydroxyacid dehydrogenase